MSRRPQSDLIALASVIGLTTVALAGCERTEASVSSQPVTAEAPESPEAPAEPAKKAKKKPATSNPAAFEAKKSNARNGKIIIANPAKVCADNGGRFGGSFTVEDVGGPFIQVITSVELNEKLVKTGPELKVKLLRNRQVVGRKVLEDRTQEFVITKSGFSHIPIPSGETIEVKVFPGEVLSIQDEAIRNFGKKACVKLRRKRLPEE